MQRRCYEKAARSASEAHERSHSASRPPVDAQAAPSCPSRRSRECIDNRLAEQPVLGLVAPDPHRRAALPMWDDEERFGARPDQQLALAGVENLGNRNVCSRGRVRQFLGRQAGGIDLSYALPLVVHGAALNSRRAEADRLQRSQWQPDCRVQSSLGASDDRSRETHPVSHRSIAPRISRWSQRLRARPSHLRPRHYGPAQVALESGEPARGARPARRIGTLPRCCDPRPAPRPRPPTQRPALQ